MLNDVSILIVEPGETAQNPILHFLQQNTDADIFHAKKPSEALDFIKNNNKLEVLLTDLFLPDKDGLELIQNGVGKNPAMVPVVLMPPGDRRYIVESLQAGVYFYVNKPYDYEEILEVIKNAVEYQKLVHLSLNHAPRLRSSDGFAGIIGESQSMKTMFKTIENITACNHGNVLIHGESGTGKELVAQAIHNLTPDRRGNNFVPVNCAAIPEELLESELFGYEKGAFTGANRAKIGRLQHADKGTLFLDEIGDMKPGLQAKLLRVLQEQSFEPVGSVKSTEIDIRVIAATNCDLDQAVREGKFREDLFYRLSVVPITLPPLRERKEDVAHLVEKFLLMYNRGRQTSIRGFTPRAMEKLHAYDWPGNVRELQNLIQRMCILHSGDMVDADALPQKFKKIAAPPDNPAPPEEKNNPAEPLDFHTMTSEFENRLILKALHSTGWNKKEAARLLNMKRTTLIEKIKKRNLDEHNVA
ncbi:MAG: sigma-54-dependent transcriptional regulator [Thermodesulfobacteriota bacterium]